MRGTPGRRESLFASLRRALESVAAEKGEGEFEIGPDLAALQRLGELEQQFCDLARSARRARGDEPSLFDALDLPPEAQSLQDAYWKASREWAQLDAAYHTAPNDLLKRLEPETWPTPWEELNA